MISETFIKMCREAKELQDNWEPKPGDFVEETVRHMYYWLPRQEDLQNILSKTWLVSEPQVLFKFINWFKDYEYAICRTLNELWLCFYMHMEHSKTWNDGTWETIT